ncbi:MAG: GNAT family N-acetyltransferase, partial [Tateyamaria sp.]|nr:GNAT family N-acetyltransferase [Tateyamaria sp.]
GKCIGRRLLDAATKYASEKEAGSVWLTTNAENSPSIVFYLAQGYKYVGQTHFRIEDKAYLNNLYSYHLA